MFSDIHGNLEALETAVGNAGSKQVDQFAVLGDTVGYGANPNECLEWAMDHASIHLLGNHEKALVDLSIRESFSDFAFEAIVWTSGIMNPALVKKIPDLTHVVIREDITFAHASPANPEEFPYLTRFEDAVPAFQKMQTPVCFIGHTHVPSCFCELTRSMVRLEPGILKLENKGRMILNPGSVGQPRDRDPRLSYGIFDSEKKTFEIVRLEYENRKAAEKIYKAGLPRYLGDRLL